MQRAGAHPDHQARSGFFNTQRFVVANGHQPNPRFPQKAHIFIEPPVQVLTDGGFLLPPNATLDRFRFVLQRRPKHGHQPLKVLARVHRPCLVTITFSQPLKSASRAPDKRPTQNRQRRPQHQASGGPKH